MTTPKLTFERRLELLESSLHNLVNLQAAQDRLPQGVSKRWTYWALTSLPYEGDYPGNGGNTFPIRFVDPTYTPTIGGQSLDAPVRSTTPRTVGRTTNGQWCAPGELVMATPIPPPPGTTDKGRWLITPQKTYYYGFLQGTLNRLSSTTVAVHTQSPAGTWNDISFALTVWDARFLATGVSLPANTWVRFEWESVAWVVTNAGCEPEEVA